MGYTTSTMLVAAVMLVAAACGDDDGASVAEFCEEGVDLMGDVARLRPGAIEEARDLDVPSEIAEDWDVFVNNAEAVETGDDDEFDSRADFDAQQRIRDYIVDHCQSSS